MSKSPFLLPIVFLSCFSLFLISPSFSFDISHILSQYPSFSTFSNYLAQTQLAQEINSRQAVTVLAVENSGISVLSGKPMDVIKNVLSVHVILDYYDIQKFHNLHDKSAVLTTLFQASGLAAGQTGFINVTIASTGAVTFTSAAADQSPHAGGSSTLIKSIESEPYNISVVQISSIILPSALLAAASPQSSSPSPSPVTSPAPAPAPAVQPPVPASSPVPASWIIGTPAASPVWANSPAPVTGNPPAPANSPVMASAPGSVNSPAASPGQAEGRSPGSASPGSGDDGDSKSGAGAISGVKTALIVAVTLLWAIYLQ